MNKAIGFISALGLGALVGWIVTSYAAAELLKDAAEECVVKDKIIEAHKKALAEANERIKDLRKECNIEDQ